MAVTVEGVYKDGVLELTEKPTGLHDGPVRVTIEENPAIPEPRYLERGKYAPGPNSTLEDFKIAEWHGEPEFDDLFPPE